VKCHACGQANDDKALFCVQCRRPLVAPAPLPSRIEPLSAPPLAPAGAAPGTMGGGPAPDVRDRFAPPKAGADGRRGADDTEVSEYEAWSAIIGPNNTDYYLERFSRLSSGDTARWHWPAALLTWPWMMYRKMWGWAAFFFFLFHNLLLIPFAVLVAVVPAAAPLWIIGYFVALFAIPGMSANGMYYRHCRNKIAKIRRSSKTNEQFVARLEAQGGTGNGIVLVVAFFVLIALVGILAAVALPAYQTYTVKAKVSEAVVEGLTVATAVGRVYEQSGALPSDVDKFVAAVPHPSRYVSRIRMDGSNGIITVDVDAGPRAQGAVLLVPNQGADKHVTWTCSSEELQRYLPASCRAGTPAR
jgi:type IV pilus assembly protein PilA